jgi:hypothetical protein
MRGALLLEGHYKSFACCDTEFGCDTGKNRIANKHRVMAVIAGSLGLAINEMRYLGSLQWIKSNSTQCPLSARLRKYSINNFDALWLQHVSVCSLLWSHDGSPGFLIRYVPYTIYRTLLKSMRIGQQEGDGYREEKRDLVPRWHGKDRRTLSHKRVDFPNQSNQYRTHYIPIYYSWLIRERNQLISNNPNPFASQPVHLHLGETVPSSSNPSKYLSEQK